MIRFQQRQGVADLPSAVPFEARYVKLLPRASPAPIQPQHPDFADDFAEAPPSHPQLGAVLFRIPLTMAATQPTPDATAMALVGQFRRQAPHSMHRSRAATMAKRPRISMTA
jgi:hypothetical protein